MSWSKVSYGFDVEEETRNFGTRAVALGHEAVFESTTLAVIESSDVESLNPKPWSLSKIHPQGCFVSVLDNSLNVFGTNLSQLLFSLGFGSVIEEIEWSEDGLFIFIGLQGGSLLAVHVPTETLFKISSALDTSGDDINGRFFTKIKSFSTDTVLDIVIVTSSRKIIRIHGSCVENMVKCCTSQQDPALRRNALSNVLATSLKLDVLSSPTYCKSQAKVAESSYCGPLVIIHNNTIEHWIMTDGSLTLINSAPLEETDDVVQACITPDQRFVICRLINGALQFVDLYTLEPCCLWNEHFVEDFSVICFGEEDNKILMLVRNEMSSFNFISYSYPDYSLYFKLPNISESSLPIGLQDSIYYLEFFGDDIIKTAKVKTIVESDPKSRLERLLLRGKFKEAEEFCRCFNLSMAEINKYKAKKIADDISVWKLGVLADSDNSLAASTLNDVGHLFQTLISILDEIKDFDFVVELCITSVPCKLELIENLLQYAILKLDKIKPEEIVNNINYVEKLMDTMKLFRTFTELQNIPHSPHTWAKFSHSDFFKDCQNYIIKGDVSSAVVLCQGYWREMSVGLSPTSAVYLLDMLPCKVPRTDMFLWLETYLPLFLSLHEDTFQLFNTWIAKTITVISCLEKDIELCHDLVAEVLSILNKTFSGSRYLPFYLSMLTDYLVDTIKILKKLIYLKCEHGVTVPFERMPSSHSKEEKVELIFSLLEKIHYDDIEVLIRHFIDPYSSDHSLRCDEILLEYLLRQEAVGFSEVWKQQTDEIWESRSIKFAEFIYNKSDKTKAIVYILKNAPVPWSETISEFEKIWYKSSSIQHRVEIANIKKMAIIQTFLQKYGIPQFDIDTIDYGKINDILSYVISEANFENQRDLFNDIQQLGKIISQNSTMLSAYCAFLCESLSSGCTKEAIEILEEEVSEDILPDIYTMCIDVLIGLSDEWIHNSNYIKENVEILFSRIIFKLPEKKLPTDFMQIITDLKINYNVEVSVHDMKKKENKIAIASKCISKLLASHIDEEPETSTDYIKNIKDLAAKLNIPFWSTCLALASQAVFNKNLDIATDCIECLIAENSDGNIPAEKIYDIVMQILRYGVTNNGRNTYKHLASLIKTSSLKGVSTATPDFVNKMVVCNLVMDLVERDEFMKAVWYTDSMFVDAISHQPDIPHNHLSLLINLLSKEVSVTESEFKGVEIFLYDLISQLPKCLHSAAISLRICLAFEELNYQQVNNQQRIISEAGMMNIKGVIRQMISNTLLKIVYSNSFDLNVALSLLFYSSQDKALRWIDNVSFKTEQFRLHNLALLAQVYCALCNLENHLNDYAQLFTISKWNRQFKQYSISFENIFNEDAVKLGTVKSLMKLPIFNCNLLEIFCSSFSCDYQELLLFYLNHVLTSWKPEYTVEDEDGEYVIKSKYDDLYNKCINIAFEIDMTPNQLCSYIFKTVWSRINPYYYEVFSVMINLIKEMDEDCHFDQLKTREILLDFLLSYKRISKPGKKEQSMWDYDDELQLADFQVISSFRLPFRELPDLWDFIAPELSLDNYKQWLVLPSWLDTELPSDLVCVFTIKNLQRQAVDSKEGWDLQLKRQDLLSKITECADRIESLETATTALYWAVNNAIPPGADQVEAAQHCLFKADQWKREEENSKSRGCSIKVEKKYMSIKIRHILHKYNLTKIEYLNLTTQPLELFRALYADSSITDNFSNPGINDAARIIAHSSEYTHQLTSIKKELLLKWLTVSSNPADDSSDFEQENIRCFEDLKRIVYMLKGEDDPVYKTILHNNLFLQDENVKPIQMKLRSLQTLLSLMPHQNLYSNTGKTTDELMRLLETFQFVYDLERVGICYAVYEFEAMPKDKIILNLLMNPSMLRCIIAADMALAYNLKCTNIWNKILGFFISHNLADKLEKYLVRISNWSRPMLDINILMNAWNTVIKSHIVKVERSSTNNTEFTSLLLKCPVLDKLDLSYLKGNTKFKINSLKLT